MKINFHMAFEIKLHLKNICTLKSKTGKNPLFLSAKLTELCYFESH